MNTIDEMSSHDHRGSSPDFPLNLGMSEGNLVGTGGQFGSWKTRSFISLDRSGKFNVSRKGSLGWGPEFQLGGLEVLG
jgi:hypothetical protein